MTAPSSTSAAADRCGGEGCVSHDHPCLVHNVRLRTVYCRLCTSCVLRHHPGAFCFSCFDILDSPPPPDRPLARCSRCPAVAHLACHSAAAASAAADCLCPSCSSPHGFSYFSTDERPAAHGGQRVIDLPSAKVLHAAAQIAAASMARAVAATRADAERKVKEAVVAGKRAREMIDRAAAVSMKESERAKDSVKTDAALATVVAETKKRLQTGYTVPAIVASSLSQNREKGMKIHKPLQAVPRPSVVPGVTENDSNKALPVNSAQNRVTADAKDRVSSLTHIPNHMKQDQSVMETKGPIPGSQDATRVKEEDTGLTEEPDNSAWMHQLSQDASVSRVTNGAMLAVMPNTTSLHS